LEFLLENLKRKRENEESNIQTLLGSVSARELRNAVYSLKGGSIPPAKNRVELETLIIESGLSEKEIEDALLLEESATPFKHFIITTYEKSSLSTTKSSLDGTQQHQIKFTTCLNQEKDELIILTIQHLVQFKEWQDVDEQNRKLVTKDIRHPIVIRFLTKSNIAIVSYPGFSQGSATKPDVRLQYETIISNLFEYLEKEHHLLLKPFPLRRALEDLIEQSSPVISIIAANLDSFNGTINLDAKNKNGTINTLIQEILNAIGNVSHSEVGKVVKGLLKDRTSRSMLVKWNPLNVVTRIQFWDNATEFLIIWGGEEKEYSKIFKIVELVTEIENILVSPAESEVWKFICSRNESEILNPALLSGKFAITGNKSKMLLLSAVKSKIITPVYRLKTDKLLIDYDNKWTQELPLLDHQFITVDNEVFDGQTPQNIEVAFMRTRGEQK
jgi:hypothetical protein